MTLRYVVVPAVPTITGSMRQGSRFHYEAAPIGFNLYDTGAKCRLGTTYDLRKDADTECQRLNLETFTAVESTQDHIQSVSALNHAD